MVDRASVIITTGGTGITSRDSTYEVVSGLLEALTSGKVTGNGIVPLVFAEDSHAALQDIQYLAR